MNPAFSVILFTTASGAGYGLLAWLGVAVALGLLPADRLYGFVALGLATALFTIGLLSSTFHLGRPERAWRALSQWRSSWLSREGVAAVATYLPTAALALGWIVLARLDGVFALLGLLSAVLAAATVLCTGMIYQSLKPIPQWNVGLTTPVYLWLSAYTGGLLMVLLSLIFEAYRPAYAWLTIVALLAAAAFKLSYWRAIDTQPARSDLRTATGLTRFDSVRLFEAPHTEANFVMREMGFVIARKHSAKLRRIAVGLLFAAPAVLLAGMLLASAGPAVAMVLALLATLSAGVGVATERWLFFAEAKHLSMIYYGQPAAARA